jgi:hypothetical protein
MTQFGEMLNKAGRRVSVLTANLVEFVGREPINQNSWHTQATKMVQGRIIASHYRREEKSINAALMQRLDHCKFLLGIVVRLR